MALFRLCSTQRCFVACLLFLQKVFAISLRMLEMKECMKENVRLRMGKEGWFIVTETLMCDSIMPGSYWSDFLS